MIKKTAKSKCTVRSKTKAKRPQTQILYTGNLSDNTTEGDLYELFGLRSTKYLKPICCIKMSTNSNNGKKTCFAYMTAPEHVTAELKKVKLNTVQL